MAAHRHLKNTKIGMTSKKIVKMATGVNIPGVLVVDETLFLSQKIWKCVRKYVERNCIVVFHCRTN